MHVPLIFSQHTTPVSTFSYAGLRGNAIRFKQAYSMICTGIVHFFEKMCGSIGLDSKLKGRERTRLP